MSSSSVSSLFSLLGSMRVSARGASARRARGGLGRGRRLWGDLLLGGMVVVVTSKVLRDEFRQNSKEDHASEELQAQRVSTGAMKCKKEQFDRWALRFLSCGLKSNLSVANMHEKVLEIHVPQCWP